MHFLPAFGALLFAGSFGGFVSGLILNQKYQIAFGNRGWRLNLGFLGDCLVGMSAALAAFGILNPLIDILPETSLTEEASAGPYMKIISVGVIAGFTGYKLLRGLSDTLMKNITVTTEDVEERVTSLRQSDAYLRLGDSLLDKSPVDAETMYRRALEADSTEYLAQIGIAKALKRRAIQEPDQASNLYSQAIEMLTKLIKTDGKNERAYYNRACYKSLHGAFDTDNILDDLQSSIDLLGVYKYYAKHDEDLERVRNTHRFNELIE